VHLSALLCKTDHSSLFHGLDVFLALDGFSVILLKSVSISDTQDLRKERETVQMCEIHL